MAQCAAATLAPYTSQPEGTEGHSGSGRTHRCRQNRTEIVGGVVGRLRASIQVEYFAGPIGIAKQPCADAADRVAELDRVPPGTVRRALDASSRIGYAQRPATKDQPTSIEDSPVCLSPPLVGLE